MKKSAIDARDSNSLRYRKVVFTFLLFICIVGNGLLAQNIYFQFSNSTYSQYSLSDIRKITFSVINMNLSMADGSMVSLPLNTISSFNYTGYAGTTSISNLDYAKRISVYPNPGNGSLTIKYNAPVSGSVNIDFLATGGEILNTVTRPSKAGNNEISIIAKDFAGQSLPPGIYLCRIRNSEKSSIVKIIISK